MCDVFNLQYFHKYKDIFGSPRKGAHASRIPLLDVATVDTIGTIVIALLVAYMLDWSYWKTVLGAFAIALFMHVLFGVRTKITAALGLVA